MLVPLIRSRRPYALGTPDPSNGREDSTKATTYNKHESEARTSSVTATRLSRSRTKSPAMGAQDDITREIRATENIVDSDRQLSNHGADRVQWQADRYHSAAGTLARTCFIADEMPCQNIPGRRYAYLHVPNAPTHIRLISCSRFREFLSGVWTNLT